MASNGGAGMNWDVYTCPFCGGDAPMGVMSFVARCEKCGAHNTQFLGGKPTEWVRNKEGDSEKNR